MNSYVSQTIKNMPPSSIRKFFDIVNTMDNAISLGVGEPDFATPWHIRECAIESLERGYTTYTSNQGMLPLRNAIANYLKEKIGVEYSGETEVLVTVGASEGIYDALRALVDPGDEVLVVEPSYVSYKPCVTMCGAVPVVVSCKAENEFRLTPEDMLEKITPKTKVLILPFPNNPTGAIMEKEDLEAIRKVIIEHNLSVISDEIYSELTYGVQHVSIASLEGMRERTVVLNGFSKAFAMTGWRLGYAAGPEEIIYNMNKIHQYIIMCAPTSSQFAGLEALQSEYREEDVARMRDAYDERRKFMLRRFEKMGLECFEPKGAFYVFPSIKNTGMDSTTFCEKLLYDQKLAVIPGTAFGDCGEGFIRCSYAYSIDSIEKALSRMEKFMAKCKFLY